MKVEKYISFDNELIKSYKPNEDDVITQKALEETSFSLKLKMTLNSSQILSSQKEQQLLLNFHYPIPLHVIKDMKIEEDREWLQVEGRENDERVIFIKGE